MIEYEGTELTLIELDVDGTPPDIVLAGFFVDDTLVLGTATGLLSGKVDESASGRDDGAFITDGIFVEQCYRGVALDLDPVHIKASLGEVLEIAANDCVG